MPIKIKSPSIIQSAGNKPKVIEEYIGKVNSKSNNVSIARMISPGGWDEPGQKPEFDEYTIVLKGELNIKTENEEIIVKAGEAIITKKGEWVQYRTPHPEGAEYISVCLPAFSLDTVNRDEK